MKQGVLWVRCHSCHQTNSRSTEDTDLNQKTAWLALSLSSSTIRLVTEGVLLQRLHGVMLLLLLLLATETDRQIHGRNS